jgi:predicted Zn-dependent peptidase
LVERNKQVTSEHLYQNLEVRKTTLPAGLRVVTESIPHLRSVSLGVWLERGSRQDPEGLEGCYHFLEHALFKGTDKYDAPGVARLIDSIGGHVDAFTTKEHMCYHARVLDEFVPRAVELLSELLLRPTLPDHEIERERGVILEEIKMYEDAPDDLVHTAFVERHWPGHDLAKPILGTRDSVAAITRNDLLRVLHTQVAQPTLLITAAGNLEHEAMLDLLEPAFRALPNEAEPLAPPSPPQPSGGLCHKTRQALSQAYLLIGVPALRRGHEQRYCMSVLNALLGTGASSRLYQKVREELGLAYEVYSDSVAYSDAGVWMVYAGTDVSSVPQLTEAVLGELRQLKAEPPSEDELRRAKDQIRSSALLGLESTSHRMGSLAHQEMEFGRQFSLEERLRRVEQVSAENVQELAELLFRPEHLTLALLSNPDARDGAPDPEILVL